MATFVQAIVFDIPELTGSHFLLEIITKTIIFQYLFSI